MAFDFELSVSGLCLLTFKGDKRKPAEVNVLLVKTAPPEGRGDPSGGNGHHHDNGNGNGHADGHRHFPLLTYSAGDLTARSSQNHKLVPASNGQLSGQRDLEGKGGIELAALGVNPGIDAVWHPDAIFPNAPGSRAEERYLNWIPALRRVDPDVPAPLAEVPFAGLLKPQVTAWIKITQGRLEAREVARGTSGQYLIWNFGTESGEFDSSVSQALAGKIILRIENLERPVQIRGLDEPGSFVELAAPPNQPDWTGHPLVQASITNLPDQEVFPSPKRLVHFAQYFDLVPGGLSPAVIRLPESASSLDTTVGTFCPPGSHT